jgi:hypothetical protein
MWCAAALVAINTARGATVLWDEQVNGILDGFPFAPTNLEFVIHPIGVAADEVNYVRGSILTIPTGPNFYDADEDEFWFTVPPGRQLTGLTLTQTNTYNAYAWGGFYASTNGPWDGTGLLGDPYGWHAHNVPGPNDIFALLGISSNLPSGPYSLNVIPGSYALPGPDTVHYTLTILTEPVMPRLEIRQAGGVVNLFWATNDADSFLLQSTTNLASVSGWSTMTNEVSVVGGNFVLATSMLSDRQYFRLLRQ